MKGVLFMQKEKTLWSRFLVTLTSLVLMLSVIMPDISVSAVPDQTRGKIGDDSYDITDIVDIYRLMIKINGISYDLTDESTVLPQITNGNSVEFDFDWRIPDQYMSDPEMRSVLSKKVFHYLYSINDKFSGVKDLNGTSSTNMYMYTIHDGQIDIQINDPNSTEGTSGYNGTFGFKGQLSLDDLDTDDLGDYKFNFFGKTFTAPGNDSLKIGVDKSSGNIYRGDDGEYYVDFSIKGGMSGKCNKEALSFSFVDNALVSFLHNVLLLCVYIVVQ